ncbi:MAG: twin-arginine translocation signal domain-containing protein, partial [Planctomycetota bacterium]
MAKKKGVSRRTFLTGMGAVAAGGAAPVPAVAAVAEGGDTGPKVLGPGPVSIALRLNGEARKLKV